MFTGIIEATGTVKEVISNASNKIFWIESSISSQLKEDQSVSHSGVCLTVEEVKGDRHRVTAIDETLQKTTLDNWEKGMLVNLERCLQLNDRIDGHIVQGHVDTRGTCIKVYEKKGSWEYVIKFSKQFAHLVIEKGSICVNGISLTAFDVKKKSFRIAVIPYTYQHTNIDKLKIGNTVNLEFDLIGKYMFRRLSLSEGPPQRKRNK